ncbi:hypothetical protein ACQR0Z_04820 [Bradyrhizobium sp. HKCCYLS3077]|uniref:hypothetical protein n=1 Tax=Bradyrhizobium sp. HKCCYLS3077 TaxID=3420761 RepID=UPI003EBFA7A2
MTRKGCVGEALMDDPHRSRIGDVPILGGEFQRNPKIFERIDEAAPGQGPWRMIVEPAGVTDAIPMQVGREEDRRMSRNHTRLLARSSRLSFQLCNVCSSMVATES